jgi:ATP-dependent DNA helicase RecG
MNFIAKHLPDPFYLEGDIRISLREKIFREVISNLLIHREYLSPFPAKLVIEKDKVFTENANKAHGFGAINPKTFSPFPKNPKIASFFREIGRADKLGSGIRNLFKYTPIYSNGKEPKLIEDDIFKMIIPIPHSHHTQKNYPEKSPRKTTQKSPRNHPENSQSYQTEPAYHTKTISRKTWHNTR